MDGPKQYVLGDIGNIFSDFRYICFDFVAFRPIGKDPQVALGCETVFCQRFDCSPGVFGSVIYKKDDRGMHS